MRYCSVHPNSVVVGKYSIPLASVLFTQLQIQQESMFPFDTRIINYSSVTLF